MTMRKRIVRWTLGIGVIVLIVGGIAWDRLLREVEPEPIVDDVRWFEYGSLGGEAELGIPYWIWVVLPRVFPDLMPGSGGWRAFGLCWEEGEELPIGFTKRVVGFPRVGNNCALCHVASFRRSADAKPEFIVGAPAHTLDVLALFDFLTEAASDPRFNADVILAEIDQIYELGPIERALYRYVIVPLTRDGLREQGRRLAWAHEQGKSAWGPGRDDSFNLPKFMLANMPPDGSHGPSDFGSVWNLAARSAPGALLNWGGESPALRTVVVDSAVGVGARPGARFEADMTRLEHFLRTLPPPPWPYADGPHAIDTRLAARGEPIYRRLCSDCHEPDGERCNTVIPLREVGTDPERFAVWSAAAAERTNRAIDEELGVPRPGLLAQDGYLASPLDGIWARAPYLHNGSVPTLRALLSPVEQRPSRFYRGYDVYDPIDVGFVTAGARAERAGRLHDVAERGNGNQGHLYGTELGDDDRVALLEYLETK